MISFGLVEEEAKNWLMQSFGQMLVATRPLPRHPGFDGRGHLPESDG